MSYENVFTRNLRRKIRFEGTYKSPGGELVRYTGTVINIGGGTVWTIDDVKGTLVGSNKPAGKTLDATRFNSSSMGALKQKLRSVLGGLQIYKDEDPLKAELERDRHERLRSSATVERTVRREPAPAAESPKIFGLDPTDKENLSKLFEQAFRVWAFEHKDLEEYSDRNKTPEQIAEAQRNLKLNVEGMSKVVFLWAKTGRLKVLDVSVLNDAEAFLKQRHQWFGQRKRGEPMATPFVAPREEPTEESKERALRKMSLEELRAIERERQRRVMRAKGLHYTGNGLGDVR